DMHFGFDKDRDRVKRGYIFQAHRYCSGNGITHNHVDLSEAREQSEDLADVVALKFAYANTAAFNCGIVLSQDGSRRCRRGGLRGGWRSGLRRSLNQQRRRLVSGLGWVGRLS